MNEKNILVINYINSIKKTFEYNGFFISKETIDMVTDKYIDSPKSFEEIKEEIDQLVQDKLEEIRKKQVVNNKYFQSFNYHTHTNRCGHSDIASDKEYVEFAKRNGIKQLGFSDHVPVSELEYQDINQQMHISDVEEYINSIRKLQQENPDMKLLCGFEAEFAPMKEQFLGELREKVDYMILGQHFVQRGIQLINTKNNPNYPIEYAKMVCKAMESGIFDIVAHPDIFMQYRDSLESEEAKNLFAQNAVKASEMICEKAKEIGIPLELNFAGVDKNNIMQDGELSYPHSLFWKVAEKIGNKVLYGVDAHTPKQFDRMVQNKEYIDRIIDTSKLNFVDIDYNPVEARRKNSKLQELYKRGQEKSLTFETHLVDYLVGGIMNNMSDEIDANSISYGLTTALDTITSDFSKEATTRTEQAVSKIEQISQNTNLDSKEKAFYLSRANSLVKHTNDTYFSRYGVIERAKQSIDAAVELGCKSKLEIKNTLNRLTEAKSTKNEEKSKNITNNLYAKVKMNVKQDNQSEKNGPILKKINKEKNNTENAGFINIISILMLVSFICGLGAGIVYVLYKMNIV